MAAGPLEALVAVVGIVVVHLLLLTFLSLRILARVRGTTACVVFTDDHEHGDAAQEEAGDGGKEEKGEAVSGPKEEQHPKGDELEDTKAKRKKEKRRRRNSDERAPHEKNGEAAQGLTTATTVHDSTGELNVPDSAARSATPPSPGSEIATSRGGAAEGLDHPVDRTPNLGSTVAMLVGSKVHEDGMRNNRKQGSDSRLRGNNKAGEEEEHSSLSDTSDGSGRTTTEEGSESKRLNSRRRRRRNLKEKSLPKSPETRPDIPAHSPSPVQAPSSLPSYAAVVSLARPASRSPARPTPSSQVGYANQTRSSLSNREQDYLLQENMMAGSSKPKKGSPHNEKNSLTTGGSQEQLPPQIYASLNDGPGKRDQAFAKPYKSIQTSASFKEEEEEEDEKKLDEGRISDVHDEARHDMIPLILSQAKDDDNFSPYAYYLASLAPAYAQTQEDAISLNQGYGGPSSLANEASFPYMYVDGAQPTDTRPTHQLNDSTNGYTEEGHQIYFADDNFATFVPHTQNSTRESAHYKNPGNKTLKDIFDVSEPSDAKLSSLPPTSGTSPKNRKKKNKKRNNRRVEMDDSYMDRAEDDNSSYSINQLSFYEKEEDYDNGKRKNGHRKLRHAPAPISSSSAPWSSAIQGGSVPERHRVGQRAHSAHPETSAVQNSRCGYPMPWNAEFQRILELPQDDEQQQLEKFERLSALAADFQHTAKTCGKIIITEKNLPNEFKTIKTVQVGGHAGGQKYIYHGILFKFATDWLALYGSDEYAMKAAGHELKGAMRYYLCEGLSVPLTALIDYRGYRLVCVSILPIDTTTLCYGSCDAGRTVYASDEVMNTRMKQAAARLNLKGHMAGLHRANMSSTRQFLYGPADIEGHRSWQDGRCYVLDFARVFPPTAEEGVLHTFLYRLFRPEFIKTYKKPLSSDAFSPFGGPENIKEGHNEEVREATTYLLETTIPTFARWLDEQHALNESTADISFGSHAGRIDIEAQLTELLHMEGINCRYLGRVCNFVLCKKVKKIIIHEMLGRVVKNKLRARLREVNSTSELTQNVYRKCVLDFLNLLLGQDQIMAVIKFWQNEMKAGLRTQFNFLLENDTLRQLREDKNDRTKKNDSSDEDSDHSQGSSSDELEEEEKDELYLLRSVDMFKLFKRIEQLTGVIFSKQSKRELKNNSRGFKLVVPDIIKMSAKAKHMNIVSLAEGNALWIQAKKSDTRETEDRLFRLVMSKFEASIRSTPDNRDTLNNYADVLCQKANNSSGHDTYAYLSKAFEKYKMARSNEAIFKLGNNVQNLSQEVWQNNDQLLQLSSLCYQALLSSEAEHPVSASVASSAASSSSFPSAGSSSLEYLGLYNWGRVLIKQARKSGDDKIFAQAGDKFRKALDRSRSSYAAIAEWAVHLSDIELAIIFEMAQNSPDLSHINGEWCFKKDLVGKEEFLCKVVPYIPRLEVLRLNECRVTGRTLERVAQVVGPSLLRLQLGKCPMIDDRAIGVMAKHCTNLTALDISACINLTDTAIKSISESCHSLTELNASHCPKLTLLALEFLATGCGSISDLSIAGCMRIAKNGLESFLPCYVQTLESLDISFIPNVDDTVVKCLAGCHNLRHLRLCFGRYKPWTYIFETTRENYLQSIEDSDEGEKFVKSNISDEFCKIFNRRKNNSITGNSVAQNSSDETADDRQAVASESSDEVEFIEVEESVYSYDFSPQSSGRFPHSSLHGSGSSISSTPLRMSSPTLSTLFPSTTAFQLESLCLSGNYSISDRGLEILLHGAGMYLRYLDISRCKHITSTGLGHVTNYCPHLEVLDVRGSTSFSDNIIGRILPAFASLRSLFLDKCTRVSDAAIRSWFLVSAQPINPSPQYPRAASPSSLSASPFSSPSHSFPTSPSTSRPSSPPLPLPFALSTATHHDGSSSTHELQEEGRTNISPSTSFYSLTGSSSGRHSVPLARRYPNITYLSLGHLIGITDEGIKLISEGCPNLEYLNIAHNPQIMDRSFRYLARNCNNLKTLKAKSCKGITDRGINYLASADGTTVRGCHFLTSLDLSHCLCIHKVQQLADGCPFLTDLDLFNCQHIDNNALLRILQKLPIQRLNMFGCRFVKNEALDVIAQGTSIRTLIMGCNKITDSAIAQLRKKRPDIALTVQMLSSLHKKRNEKQQRSSSSSSPAHRDPSPHGGRRSNG